jgi:uncharacterized membrane protein
MERASKAELRERLFRVSVSLKGLNAAFEIAAGAALLVVSPAWILRVTAFLTQDELAEDPHDLLANTLLHAAKHLSLGGKYFMAVYLLSHGIIKLGLVAALLEEWLGAYPAAIIVFAAFIVYQIYRFTFTHGMGLIALSLFDAIVISLVWLEYRALKERCSSRG